MSDMGHNTNPEGFEELKEAYALGVLPEEERRDFERYLEDNPSERAEVEELSSIAGLLALAPPERRPRQGLRRSLMKQVRSEARESGAAEEAGREEDRGAAAPGGWARRLFGARGVVTAAAAATILGLAVWNVSLQSEIRDLNQETGGSGQTSAYELQGSGQAEQVRGEIVRIGDQGAMLVTTDLPDLPEGKTYEMWSIKNGEPRSCGEFRATEGPEIKHINQPISGAEVFAVTVEPEGNSGGPTTDPIIQADLTQSV